MIYLFIYELFNDNLINNNNNNNDITIMIIKFIQGG